MVRVALARVVGAHGLRGQLHVRYFGGDPDNLLQLSSLGLSEREDGEDATLYEVEHAAPGRSGEVRMALAGIEDRDAAEAVRGRWVTAEIDELEPLGEGEYYSHQLVGCLVSTEAGRAVGTVREIWAGGAADLLVVEDERGEQHLIPAAEELLREVDVEGRRIVMEVPPGLIPGL